jgi:hypothetical protein
MASIELMQMYYKTVKYQLTCNHALKTKQAVIKTKPSDSNVHNFINARAHEQK